MNEWAFLRLLSDFDVDGWPQQPMCAYSIIQQHHHHHLHSDATGQVAGTEYK